MSDIQTARTPPKSERDYRWLDLQNTITTELYRIIDDEMEAPKFNALEHKRQVPKGLMQH